MQYKWFWLSLTQGSIAWPTLLATREDSKFEWTALGDSYASGVGSTNYVDGRRCLRYDQAYPVLLNEDKELADGEHIFNNVVCSGAHYNDVEDYQFYDEDKTNQPNWQFTPRPKFGNPQMATLTVGGDDIDFPGILFNCILETYILGGPALRSCDDQRKHSWDLIKSPDLVNNLDHLIKKTVTKGRQGSIGNGFKLYVTGYGSFFNEVDEDCNNVTFARTANPNPDDKEHIKMTTELRKEFNNMSLALNAAIKNAVDRNKNDGVKFIDIQGNNALDGHRFCEPGIKEPDQHNDRLWFWHYPYNEPNNDDNAKLFLEASDRVTQGLSMADLNTKFPSTADYTNAIFDAVDNSKAQQRDGSDLETQAGWDWVGARTKVFHPQVSFHKHIKDLILAEYKRDRDVDNAPHQAAPAPNPSNACHGVNGDIWVIHRDTAVKNVNDFCAQGSKSVEYNQGSVDHLRLSVDYPADRSKGPRDAPDCKKNLVDAVIDGCDGNDPINNPHNYKFGSTLTLGDGWVFKMEPLSKQINEDSCDVSYRFLFDGFEVRGKNWPDAKLGPNGEGLLKELKGCGAVTKWEFEWTPNDVKYQWYAHGQLPIGTKACVGHAVETAGGSSKGNCHGAERVALRLKKWIADLGKHVKKT
ncbi:MAG: hypothetical protein M1816_005492 [Peltula sp. TS41687]|nr:MAG: hypothetical protein M1816_005492 [Peltula sp. TS41687]